MNLDNVSQEELQRLLTPKTTKYIPYTPTPKQRAFLLMNNKEILYGGAAGGGKALVVNTPILTTTGWKTMGTLKVGDEVYDEKGIPCRVLAKSAVQYNHHCYAVKFDAGVTIYADEEHLWKVNYNGCNFVVTTKQMIQQNYMIHVAEPLAGIEQSYNPYAFGVWLAAGKKRCAVYDIDQSVADVLSEDGFYVSCVGPKKYFIQGYIHKEHKVIPSEYLLSSYNQRLMMLRGIMDCIGVVHQKYYSVDIPGKALRQDVIALISSLGIKVKVKGTDLHWRTAENMFRAHKVPTKHDSLQDKYYRVRDVVSVKSHPVQCIVVDTPSHLFLAGLSLVPTHNSVAQLMAALQYVDIPGYSAILFRKTYADLSLPGALIDMSKQWLMPFVDTKEVKWSEKDKRYDFPSGATLNFGYLESANDCYRYQGAEFQYIGMDEVTHIDPNNYRYLFSRLRKPKKLDVPLRFRATANPGGQFGEYYYQRFFVEGKDAGRIFISAGLNDNPYLDAEAYKESLAELDPIERERLLNGNWEIKATGDLFNRHWFNIVSVAEVPSAARVVRYWDLASTDPAKRKSKNKRDPDWTTGLKMAFYQGMYWILDVVHVQCTPADVETLISDTAKTDGYSVAIRMEQEPGSSGAYTTDHFGRGVLTGYDFIGVTSSGSKVERARTASTAAQNGLILIASNCRNMLALLDELDIFPYGAKDDIVDSLSGAFNYFRTTTLLRIPTSVKKTGGSYWSNFNRRS